MNVKCDSTELSVSKKFSSCTFHAPEIFYEGTNRMGKSRSSRWLPTWNISGAWNVHEENFFDTLSSVLSHLTFKASYSLTADRGPEYVTNSLAIITSYSPFRPFTSGQETGLYVSDPEYS